MNDVIKEITAAHGDRLDSLYTCESYRYHGTVVAIFLLVVGDAWELHKWFSLPDGSTDKYLADSGVLNDVGREEFRGLVGHWCLTEQVGVSERTGHKPFCR